MRLLWPPSPLATLLLLTSGAALSHADMAAWFTDFGPQVVLQNETTGAIHYTTCNSVGQPTYSPENVLELVAYPPKKNTALTGSGYYDEEKTVASIYYLDGNDMIINALFNCNMTTGLFEFDDNWVISGVAPGPVSPNSGLAGILLGKSAGYRIYYHDEDMAVNELAYKPGDQWRHKALISQDLQGSSAIAAAFSGNENITVVTARDAENIGVTRYHADSIWRISTFPHPLAGNLATTQYTSRGNITIDANGQANFTLPAWNGNPRGMGISIDAKYTRSVWYIGEDKQLYQIANKNWTWSRQDSQQADIWPTADSPGAPLAVVGEYTSGQLRIYYLVNGSIAEIKNSGGEVGWEKWTTLPSPEPVKLDVPTATTTTTTTTTPPPFSSDPPPTAETENSGSGVSTGAKIGLGLGVSLGVLAICLVSTACFLLLRRRKKQTDMVVVPSSDNSFEAGPQGGCSYEPIGSSNGSFPSSSPMHNSYGAQSPDSSMAAGYGGYDHYVWDEKVVAGGTSIPTAANTAGLYQLDAAGRPVELDIPRPVYELSDQPHAHELMGEGLHTLNTTMTRSTDDGTSRTAATSPIIPLQESSHFNK